MKVTLGRWNELRTFKGLYDAFMMHFGGQLCLEVKCIFLAHCSYELVRGKQKFRST